MGSKTVMQEYHVSDEKIHMNRWQADALPATPRGKIPAAGKNWASSAPECGLTSERRAMAGPSVCVLPPFSSRGAEMPHPVKHTHTRSPLRRVRTKK